MEKLRSLPKLVLDSEEARSVQQQYDHLIVEMDQFEKATVEVIASTQTLYITVVKHLHTLSGSPSLSHADGHITLLTLNFDCRTGAI